MFIYKHVTTVLYFRIIQSTRVQHNHIHILLSIILSVWYVMAIAFLMIASCYRPMAEVEHVVTQPG